MKQSLDIWYDCMHWLCKRPVDYNRRTKTLRSHSNGRELVRWYILAYLICPFSTLIPTFLASMYIYHTGEFVLTEEFLGAVIQLILTAAVLVLDQGYRKYRNAITEPYSALKALERNLCAGTL